MKSASFRSKRGNKRAYNDCCLLLLQSLQVVESDFFFYRHFYCFYLLLQLASEELQFLKLFQKFSLLMFRFFPCSTTFKVSRNRNCVRPTTASPTTRTCPATSPSSRATAAPPPSAWLDGTVEAQRSRQFAIQKQQRFVSFNQKIENKVAKKKSPLLFSKLNFFGNLLSKK